MLIIGSINCLMGVVDNKKNTEYPQTNKKDLSY